jgi:hypothetical protein
MADVDAKLMSFVETALKKSPDLSTNELFEQAKKKYPSAKKLSVRQFHARYPLQVKRRMSLAKAKPTRKKPAAPRPRNRPVRRDAIRGALLRFASDLSAAQERHDLVKVLANVDQYVDEVLEATKR